MERPILFSAEMVKAILEGRKTQTRRVVKNILPTCRTIEHSYRNEWAMRGNDNGWIITCPYGQPGDSLWVREAWQAQTQSGQWWHEVKREDRPLLNWAWTNPVQPAYDATPPRWLPSIHMPREASRITMEIVNIRVERLQEMTFDDALEEGIKRTDEDYFLAPLAGVPDYPWLHPVVAFASLWNDINAKRGYGWEVNPWVWVIEFKVKSGG